MQAADLSRRSRLAELEGRLLRVERTVVQAEPRQQDQGELQDLRTRLTACQSDAEQLHVRLREKEQELATRIATRTNDAERLSS